MKPGGHNYHPARVPGHVKFGRALAANREAEKNKKKKDFDAIDLSKPNWSVKKRK